ncbi:hypothetical protein [uncultured Chryseobacterium sp.]|uniref:phosphoribosyltransferase-like protein n=1 Tax=uncultured Chryseobacterium sp. TaxID=259322 RepID=UPI0025D3BB46|nr:hypothetical protein [uncultured Chryseobacterium sp.]
MPHKYCLNQVSLRKLETLMPRLKYSILPTKVIKWLENFDEDEVESMLNLLCIYEYIPYNEFLSRLDDYFADLLNTIPKNDKILIFPFGKIGKSGMFVTYPLSKTKSFGKRNTDIEISKDVKNLKISNVKHIVFLDDFIGTGNTFIKDYTRNNDLQEFIKDNKINSLYLLSCIAMQQGVNYIKSKIDIKVFADIRDKLFENKNTPLSIFETSSIKKIKNIVQKYGNSFNLEYDAKKITYGYGESQSFISFFHSTPNNTLSIIWNDVMWKPLFARSSNTKMNEARELKKNISFFINLCDKLNIDLESSMKDFKNFKFNNNGKIKNSKHDHSIILLLFLKKNDYEDFLISHILGLSRYELNLIYLEAKNCDLIDNQYKITSKGQKFLKEISKITYKESIREENNYNLMIKNHLYLPSMLNGAT